MVMGRESEGTKDDDCVRGASVTFDHSGNAVCPMKQLEWLPTHEDAPKRSWVFGNWLASASSCPYSIAAPSSSPSRSADNCPPFSTSPTT